MSNDLVIALPDVAPSVSIGGEWISERDALIESSRGISKVANQESFGQAGDYLKKITKTSNKLEAMRKEFSEPFRNAAELIKKAADKARTPLEDEKMRLQRLLNDYAVEQARKAEAERKAIEEAQRRAIAEQAAKAEEERKLAEEARQKAIAEAASDPLAEDNIPIVPEPEPFVPVIPEIAPVVEKAKADSVRMSKTLVFSISESDAVPRAMCSPDERKIRAWMTMNKESIIKNVKENIQPMEGVRFSLETKVISR